VASGRHELGNHGYGHPDLHAMPLEAYERAVLDGEPVTRALLAKRGQRLRYWRFPFSHTGPDAQTKEAFEAFLAAHDYRVAPFTCEFDDFIYAKVYWDAKSKATVRRRPSGLGLPRHIATVLGTCEQEAQFVFGRAVPQIILGHANALTPTRPSHS